MLLRIEETTPAQYAAQFDITLVEVCKLINVSRTTLERWHKKQPLKFHAMILGAQQIKLNKK